MVAIKGDDMIMSKEIRTSGKGKKPKRHLKCPYSPKCPSMYSQEWTLRRHIKQKHDTI